MDKLSYFSFTLTPYTQLIIDDFRFTAADRLEGRSKIRLSCRVQPTLTVFRHSVLMRILSGDPSLLESLPIAFSPFIDLLENGDPPIKPNSFHSETAATLNFSVSSGDKVWLLTNAGLLGFLRFRHRIEKNHAFDAVLTPGINVSIARNLKPQSTV